MEEIRKLVEQPIVNIENYSVAVFEDVDTKTVSYFLKQHPKVDAAVIVSKSTITDKPYIFNFITVKSNINVMIITNRLAAYGKTNDLYFPFKGKHTEMSSKIYAVNTKLVL
jgi:hypothetical protein